MKHTYFLLLALLTFFLVLAFNRGGVTGTYHQLYTTKLAGLAAKQQVLLQSIAQSDFNNTELEKLKEQIDIVRLSLKEMDFWMRYLEPLAYKQVNGPLPVEWETEVFEKFEKPYKRIGAGLTLAALYLEEKNITKDSLMKLVHASVKACQTYSADSITSLLKTHDHFYLCNRLFLLNLAAIYTTGFECPDPDRVIPELRHMMASVYETSLAFNDHFPSTPLPDTYLERYRQTMQFLGRQTGGINGFDHLSFLRDFVNPLFALNQDLIRRYHVISHSTLDYSLNKNTTSIFSKTIYTGQNTRGIFSRVRDEAVLAQIEETGRLLFHDPILSGNNLRSCASCHKPNEGFTDTAVAAPLHFDGNTRLARNSPSLLNAAYNHLVMLDGRHITLQEQTKAVITNPREMACDPKELMKKIMSCKDYKKTFTALLKYTPQETEVTIDHICSAITMYYGRFSRYYSPFDEAMNNRTEVDPAVHRGFNLFMGKAQCGTCHFVPQFNGVKPPYVGSEFEVIGVPADPQFKSLSADKGRFDVNPAAETLNAFRTGTVRNSALTGPYMHNGAFKTLEEVVDFYDGGGGAGRGLTVPNQTLSSDSLHLAPQDKIDLVAFMRALNEKIPAQADPSTLPTSTIKQLNNRKINGNY